MMCKPPERGYFGNVATDVEIDRALAAVAATLNDQRLEHLDPERVQEIVSGAVAGEPALTVDPGGGLHDDSGARIGAIRRTDSGEWIAERQNDAAEHAEAAIPRKSPPGRLRRMIDGLRSRG